MSFEIWKSKFVEVLIKTYGVSKKKASKVQTECLKYYYYAGITPDIAAHEEFTEKNG